MIVENGNGIEGANAYAEEAEVAAYHTAHGNAAWAVAAAPDREAAIVRASAGIDGRYGARWRGERATSGQGLDWPRHNAWDADGFPLVGVPTALKYAVAEAALVELGSPGALTQALERGGRVAAESVGSISTSYFADAPAGTAYPAIGQALRRLLRGGGMRIVRV